MQSSLEITTPLFSVLSVFSKGGSYFELSQSPVELTAYADSLQSKDRRNKDTILRYDSSEISEGLGLAPSRLFFYALAAGGDYSPGMKGY